MHNIFQEKGFLFFTKVGICAAYTFQKTLTELVRAPANESLLIDADVNLLDSSDQALDASARPGTSHKMGGTMFWHSS